MLFLLFLLVQPCQAVSAAPKPRVVEASATSTGAAQTVSPCVTAVAKPCGLHGLPMKLRSAPFAGRATGSRRPDPMDIPGLEDVDALRPTSVS